MEKLKYRGWDKEHHFMFDVTEITFDNEKGIEEIRAWREALDSERCSRVGRLIGKEAEIMEFIGVENGTDLYVADVIQIEDDNDKLFNYEIIKDGYTYSAALRTYEEGFPVSIETGYSFGEYYHTELEIEYDDRHIPLDVLFQYNCIETKGIKVIGNRYTHPELVEDYDD